MTDYSYEKLQDIEPDLAEACSANGLNWLGNITEKLLAVIEGQNDGEEWHWFLVTHFGKYICISGWCDYTGWDCQSDMKYQVSYIRESLDSILLFFPERIQRVWQGGEWIEVNPRAFIKEQVDRGYPAKTFRQGKLGGSS